MASSNSMYSRSSGGQSELRTPTCMCGELAAMKHSWTGRNPGRRFFGCPNYGRVGACSYFRWIDEPLPDHAKHIISGQVRRLEENEVELDKARKRLEEKKVEMNKTVRRANFLLYVVVGIVFVHVMEILAP